MHGHISKTHKAREVGQLVLQGTCLRACHLTTCEPGVLEDDMFLLLSSLLATCPEASVTSEADHAEHGAQWHLRKGFLVPQLSS